MKFSTIIALTVLSLTQAVPIPGNTTNINNPIEDASLEEISALLEDEEGDVDASTDTSVPEILDATDFKESAKKNERKGADAKGGGKKGGKGEEKGVDAKGGDRKGGKKDDGAKVGEKKEGKGVAEELEADIAVAKEIMVEELQEVVDFVEAAANEFADGEDGSIGEEIEAEAAEADDESIGFNIIDD
jgi:hypothetical protein